MEGYSCPSTMVNKSQNITFMLSQQVSKAYRSVFLRKWEIPLASNDLFKTTCRLKQMNYKTPFSIIPCTYASSETYLYKVLFFRQQSEKESRNSFNLHTITNSVLPPIHSFPNRNYFVRIFAQHQSPFLVLLLRLLIGGGGGCRRSGRWVEKWESTVLISNSSHPTTRIWKAAIILTLQHFCHIQF